MYHFLIDNRHDSRSLFQRNYLERINIQLLLQITFDERNVSINKKKKRKRGKISSVFKLTILTINKVSPRNLGQEKLSYKSDRFERNIGDKVKTNGEGKR